MYIDAGFADACMYGAHLLHAIASPMLSLWCFVYFASVVLKSFDDVPII